MIWSSARRSCHLEHGVTSVGRADARSERGGYEELRAKIALGALQHARVQTASMHDAVNKATQGRASIVLDQGCLHDGGMSHSEGEDWRLIHRYARARSDMPAAPAPSVVRGHPLLVHFGAFALGVIHTLPPSAARPSHESPARQIAGPRNRLVAGVRKDQWPRPFSNTARPTEIQSPERFSAATL